MPHRAQRKRLYLLAAYAFAALPFILYGAGQAVSSNANSPIDWVSPSFPARRDFDDFRQQFGSGDVVVMSWPGCTVDNPDLDRLTNHLRQATLFFDDKGTWYFDEVVSGRELLRDLAAQPSGMSLDVATQQLSGTLIGPDQRTTWIVVRFTPAALAIRDRLVTYMRAFAQRDCDVDAGNLHLAGPVIDGTSVDEASKNSLRRFGILSAGVVLLLAWWFLKSLRSALLVFGVSVYGQTLTLALIHFSGQQMNALMIVLPPLIQVLALAAGIHMVNYYVDESRERGRTGAAWRALRIGWLPCVLSAVTTAVGLASLLASNLVPVREFGKFGAAGVLAAAGLVLLFIPAVSAWLDQLALRKQRSGGESQTDDSQVPLPASRQTLHRVWDQLAKLIERRWIAVTVTGLAAMVGLGLGVSKLHSSVRIETLLGEDSRLLQDYAWLEEQVGPTVPIEVVLHFETPSSEAMFDRLDLVRRVEAQLARLPGVHGTMSASTLLPPAAPPSSVLPGQPHLVRERLERGRKLLIDRRYLSESDGDEKWRVTALVSALDEIDYAELIGKVDDRIGPTLAGQFAPSLQARATYTGIMPLVHHIQHALMRDLFVSFAWAFAVIAAVIVIVENGVAAGLIVMIPNVFPSLVLFGLLGWRGQTIDIGSVMTASVALGVAVDDTLHFMTFFRRALETGATRRDAVRHAYQHCGLAMVQTTLICSGGMSVFALSDFVPAARFAWMLVSLMFLAIIGDLIVLPALLLGPGGRIFSSTRPT